jgi:rhodanese-related sulfurtransferase
MKTFCWACVLSGMLLAMGFAVAQQAAAPKTVSDEQLAKLLEQPGKVFFLDVREPAEIATLGSIKGYVNIPLSQIESRLKEIPRDKLIVTL